MGFTFEMIDQNVAKLVFNGDIDVKDVQAYLEKYESFLDKVTPEKPLHVIIDVSNVGKASSAARKAFGEVFQDIDPRSGKSGMIGANRYLRVLSGFVIKATGTKNLRIFNTEEEALAWFKE